MCCEHCTLSADKDTAQMDEIKKTTHELFAFKMFCRFSSSWTQIHPFQVFTTIIEFLTDKNRKKSIISFAHIFSVCQLSRSNRIKVIHHYASLDVFWQRRSMSVGMSWSSQRIGSLWRNQQPLEDP